jgi:trans-AT polyketide synthase, acyltransferase and oxidoreductase domains
MKTYVFPGQGSQKKGMGASLFEEFAEITSTADKILGYSIKELCLEDPQDNISQTNYTQPALYVVNAMTWLKKMEKPDFLAGHSLGEYNALFAAGAFDFETGLKLVKERSRLMALAKGGGMAAVIGLDEQAIIDVLEENQFSEISIANYNSQYQIVISGIREEIEKAKPFFEKKGAKLYIVLPVSGAFHSKQMQKAKEEFARFIEPFQFHPLKIPVISNVMAIEYENDKIKELLCSQIISPVKWTDSVRYLMSKGEMTFEEIGIGNVLTNLIKKIKTMPPLEKFSNMEEKTSQPSEFKGFSKEQKITSSSLGSAEFKKEYGLKYAYISGGMFRGIASKELVITMGKAGMMGFFGTGGLELDKVENTISDIKEELCDKPFGMNFLHNPMNADYEDALVDIFLKHDIKNIEAAAFMQMTPSLVRYRLSGLFQDENGLITVKNKVMGKISRPETAEAFLMPAPDRIVEKLLLSGKITKNQAELAKKIPMADAICAEADSGGHTDMAQAFAIFPAIEQLRDRITTEQNYKQNYKKKIFLGLAGGIGTPQAAAAAFILGADFILTGSVNQCTVEAGTSDMAKDMLSCMNVQDTDYAPAGDMFEIGAKVQVLRKGVFFPARANKLYNLYIQHNSIDEIDEKMQSQIEKMYFKKSFEQVYEETKAFFAKIDPFQIEKAEKNPKHKMALIFRWYFGYSSKAALEGIEEDKVNFQIHTGPALGAFNQWVKGTDLEDWKNRYAAKIGVMLMEETAELLNEKFEKLKMAS